MFPTFDGGGTKRLANVICVVGPTSVAGKTLVSCNLALGLARLGKTVALFDGDLQFGDVGLAFGCDPEGYSTLDLSSDGPGSNRLRQVLSRPRNGLWVLLGVPEPGNAELISDDALVEGVVRAASAFDVVIVDTAPFWDGFTVGAAGISGLVIVMDGGFERSLGFLLKSMHEIDRSNLRHCLILPNDAGYGMFTGSQSRGTLTAEGTAIPVWSLLPAHDSVGSDYPQSLLVTELDPSSTLSAALREFTEEVASELDVRRAHSLSFCSGRGE